MAQTKTAKPKQPDRKVMLTSLCSHKTSAFKYRKAVSVQISLFCRSLPVVVNLAHNYQSVSSRTSSRDAIFFQRVHCLKLHNKASICEIHIALNVELLIVRMEISQLRLFNNL